jgi:hypothetical protein
MSGKDDLAKQLVGLAREDLAAAKALDEAADVSDSKSGFYSGWVRTRSAKH